jgi:cobalt-zinc-cadmium efflux system membrane fusion protein
MRPVVKGVSLGQKIVVDGAFHLDNERKLAELE